MSIIINEEILVKMGARGGLRSSGMVEWDESSFGSVKQILLSHGSSVHSIQMVHDLNGKLALAHRRGGDGGDFFDCVSFDSWEYLTSISGHYGAIDQRGPVVIRSLTFFTNKAIYGPFGEEEGTPFSFNFDSGVDFAGIHGRSTSSHLCAVGVYVKNSAIKHHFKPDPLRLSAAAPQLCSVTGASRM